MDFTLAGRLIQSGNGTKPAAVSCERSSFVESGAGDLAGLQRADLHGIAFQGAK